MTPTTDLTARMLFSGARILADHPEGLSSRELWRQITQQDPGIETEWRAATTGKTTAEGNFQFYTIELVKAGWLRKVNGHWYPTWAGRAALDKFTEPAAFFDAVHGRNRYWEQHRQAFDQAGHIVSAVQKGKWIALEDLADLVDLDRDHLTHWLQAVRPAGWYRALRDGGHLPLDRPATSDDRHHWLTLLEQDGFDMSEGRASVTRKVLASDVNQLRPGDGEDSAPRRAWLVRGSNVQGENLIRTLWLPDQVVSLPASRLRGLGPGASIEQVRHAVDLDYSHATAQERVRLVAEYHGFLTRMREGDIVVTNDGTAVYLGVITSGPSFVASVEKRADLQRTVDWRHIDKPLDYADDLPDEFSARVSNPDAELIELTEFVDDLGRFLDEAPQIVTRELYLPDATNELADALLVERDWLQENVELLRDRPQLILYGPPGTGKTYLAQAIAEHLVGGKPENVQLVQFHPAYSYEDFFEGYRPQQTDDGTIAFELVRGPLRRLAAAAVAHPEVPYVLIIDEINRGNLAKIFGELYFLLEYRGKSVNLLYGSDEGKGFTLPRNLIVIGTMNTADRSIALVDAAMRRRFWFVELHPDEPPTRDMLARWLERAGHPDEAALLLAELNSRIDDRDSRIGPSYLMRDAAATEKGLERIWRTQILPLLEEHHYGDGTDVRQRYGLDALRSRL